MTDYPPVTVYTKTRCLPCKRVIGQLEAAKVPFELVDIEDPAFSDARSYVTNVLKAKSVPVIVSDTHPPILGYQPEKLKALIEDYQGLSLTSNGDDAA